MLVTCHTCCPVRECIDCLCSNTLHLHLPHSTRVAVRGRARAPATHCTTLLASNQMLFVGYVLQILRTRQVRRRRRVRLRPRCEASGSLSRAKTRGVGPRPGSRLLHQAAATIFARCGGAGPYAPRVWCPTGATSLGPGSGLPGA